jgi:hypothetical protein
MESFYCSNCGAPIESNLKFCRRCGKPVNLSEATTRTLDPPPVIEPATQHMNAAQTGPSYLPPAAMMPPLPAQTTKGLGPAGQNRTVLILAGLVGFLLIALAVLAIITSRISREIVPDLPAMQPPPATSVPPVSRAPQLPVAPPVPPPPPATAAPGNPPISREMVYPGAAIIMEMNRSGGGSVLQLNTTDSYDKVVAWYTGKLRPSKTVRTVGNTTILKGAAISAIITGTDEGVTILLKDETNKE